MEKPHVHLTDERNPTDITEIMQRANGTETNKIRITDDNSLNTFKYYTFACPPLIPNLELLNKTK